MHYVISWSIRLEVECDFPSNASETRKKIAMSSIDTNSFSLHNMTQSLDKPRTCKNKNDGIVIVYRIRWTKTVNYFLISSLQIIKYLTRSSITPRIEPRNGGINNEKVCVRWYLLKKYFYFNISSIGFN